MSQHKINRIKELPVERLGIRKFNFKLIVHITGILLTWMSISMVLPLAVSLHSHDGAQFAIIASALLILMAGMLLRNILGRNPDYELKEMESYWITAIIWIVVPICGTLPYLFLGDMASFTDAAFESFSGFTTTGSSVVPYPEELPPSLLVYRSFTQWIGGIGLLLFVVAIFSNLGLTSRQLFDAEFSGTQQRRLHPHLSKSVSRLWRIYTIITLLMMVLLLVTGVPIVDSICIAFSTVSTGGFLPYHDGLSMLSNGSLMIITIFMILSGISLAELYLLITGRWRQMARDQELRTYLGLMFLSVAVCSIAFISVGNKPSESIRYSLFHIASTMSSCGFYLPKLGHWSFLVSVFTFMLIIIGASAGSTGGGIKIWRVMTVTKYIGNYVTRMLHPNAVICIKMNKKVVEKEYINKIFAYVFLYLSFIVIGAFVLTLCGSSIPDAICMAAANISNLGPSPLINNLGGDLEYAMLPDLAKWTITVLMLAGRLELFVLIAIFSPAYWRRR